ncbi:MAG: hypothetical protein ACMUJM_24455 [bacterium]
MKDIAELVRERIAIERARAQNTLLDYGRNASGTVQKVFGDMPATLTNLPPGIQLPHFLLFGGASLIPLEPISEREFLNRHGLDVRTFLELTECGLIVPSIYDREADNWNGEEHLRDLVKRSIVNGERIDAFMGEDYSDTVNSYEAIFQQKFEALSKAERLLWSKEACVVPSKTLPLALAHRVARLKRFDAEAVQQAFNFYESGDLLTFLWIIEAAKLRTAHLTAGGGKTYIAGPFDLALFQQPLAPATKRIALFDVYSSYEGSFLTQAMEYVTSEVLAKTQPFSPLEWCIEGKKLLTFLTRPDNREVRDRLWQILDELKQLAWANGNVDPAVEDYRKLIADYRKRLKEFEVVIGAAGVATGAMLGFFVPCALIGRVLGVFAGVLLKSCVTKDGSPALNAAIGQLYDRRAYRVVAGLEYVSAGPK